MTAELLTLFPHENPSGTSPGELRDAMRIVEALLFAAGSVSERDLVKRLPAGVDLGVIMDRLQQDYAARGINLVRAGSSWLFRTADDLAWLLSPAGREQRKPSRAAMEVLAIIAYHQPTTRAEIEEIRGVAVAKGTVDLLVEIGWIRPRGRRRTPGRPMTFVTTDSFLLQFGFETLAELPGADELREAGLFDAAPQNLAMLPQGSAGHHEDDIEEDEIGLEGDEALDHGDDGQSDELREARGAPEIGRVDP